MRPIFAALCFTLLWIGSAQAQSVQPQTALVIPLQGDLSVNQGQGFQRVDSRVQANVGDSLMVAPGGSASLVYPDGCQVTIQPGSVVSIAPLSPCASGSFAAELPVPPPVGAPPPAPEGFDPGLLMFGAGAAAAVTVGVLAIVLSEKPASP
jgi:hypothetical protein